LSPLENTSLGPFGIVGMTDPLVAPVSAEADSVTACHDLVPATSILVAVGISAVLWIVVGLAVSVIL
jgi:hypothetical protein